MKYYVISGEASGDLHGSNLLKEIMARDSQAEVRCWGGDKMAATGATLVKHYNKLAFMGFAEVLKNLPTILHNFRFCKRDISHFKPDVLILIDYPGFNLRIAKWARENGYKVIYYISPQVWAWNEGRVKMMRACIDLMLVILPFEETYFKDSWNWKVSYVGHPLVKIIKEHRPQISDFSDKPVVALLPGSRLQEISKKLPEMLKVAVHFPDHQFIVAMAPGMNDLNYREYTRGYQNVSLLGGLTYDLLAHARAALVTSGTATLETALFKVPQVVCYKGNPFSYAIAKKLVKVPFISLVNLIMKRRVVAELIQEDMQVSNLVKELQKILPDGPPRAEMIKYYRELEQMLGRGGDASAKAADEIQKFLQISK